MGKPQLGALPGLSRRSATNSLPSTLITMSGAARAGIHRHRPSTGGRSAKVTSAPSTTTATHCSAPNRANKPPAATASTEETGATSVPTSRATRASFVTPAPPRQPLTDSPSGSRQCRPSDPTTPNQTGAAQRPVPAQEETPSRRTQRRSLGEESGCQ
jgi:hypothetical protein